MGCQADLAYFLLTLTICYVSLSATCGIDSINDRSTLFTDSGVVKT